MAFIVIVCRKDDGQMETNEIVQYNKKIIAKQKKIQSIKDDYEELSEYEKRHPKMTFFKNQIYSFSS